MMKKRFGGMTPADFLRRHWQKRPLMVRQALVECAALVSPGLLFELAGRSDVESRLVERRGPRWRLRHGPFDRRELRRLPASGWTLLVQGVNHALPAAGHLLSHFSFIPYARLDDLMVSYAPDGGGVGPHYDDYDVFLLQGAGRRRWRIGHQRDLDLVPGAPLRILRRFRPEREWLFEAGDLLYLPPRWAHDGVAVGSGCITYSIGFRAPGAQELGSAFLDYLQEQLQLEGRYSDPGLKPARHPARIDGSMVRRAQAFLRRIRWNGGDVTRFLGRYLTEPKPHVVFSRPPRALSPRSFLTQATRRGVRLAPPTRMLFSGNAIFVNGELLQSREPAARLLKRLADRRALPPRCPLDGESAEALHRWYRAGYVHLGESDERDKR